MSAPAALKARVRSTARRAWGALSRWSGLVGLNYHRIGDGRATVYDRGLYSATQDGFDRQLRWLKAHFDVISPHEVPLALRAGRGRHVLVTFDDGYRDNHAAAFPVLRANGVPATFFVATGFVDAPRLPWWDEIAWMVRTSGQTGIELPRFLPGPLPFDGLDRQGAIRTLLWTYYRLPGADTAAFLEALAGATGSGRHAAAADSTWMTWDMLRELHAAGMTIGGHTVRHEILSRMSPDEQWAEISGCAQRLERELGAPMRTFSYPAGQRDAFDAATRDCLRRAGVVTAFTYYGGYTPPREGWDAYDLPRLGVEQHHSFDDFRALVMAPGSPAHRP